MKQQYFSMPNAQEMQSLIEFCKVMATAPFYQKLGPGGVMAIYLTAKEYDLPFMACLNGGLHTFDGKVTFSAIMIDALIIKAGHKADLLHLDEKKCVIRFTRGDRRNDSTYQPLVYEYTLDQANKAGYLKKNNWQTSPKDMLYSRCLTGGGRKHTPEVFVGVLVAGELVGDDRDSDITPLLPVNVAVSTNLLPAPTESVESPKQLEHVKLPNYEEFCRQHGIMEGSDKHEYVKVIISKNPKMNEIQVVNSAIKNEQKFLDTFNKWLEEKTKPETKEVVQELPRSMDEVSQM